MTRNKRTAKIGERFGMVARAALFAMTASVFVSGYAMAEQGAQSPQQTQQTQQQKAAAQKLQVQRANQQQKQTQQQQQKQAEVQQQQQKAQQQKQSQQGEQILKQQQQKQAQQQQAVKQEQQRQAQQAQQAKQQQQLQQQKQQEQQLKQQQQNQAKQQQLQQQQRQAQQQQQLNHQQQQLTQQQQQIARQQAQLQHYDWNTYRPGQRPPLWTQYRQNFDPTPYQWARNAPQHYNVRYVAPPGWHYQRWNYGQVYPRPYWQQQSYWLNNYSQYGLQPLPYGYVWVQNGPDALAVNSFSGTILQVIYGLFSGGGGSGLLGGLM